MSKIQIIDYSDLIGNKFRYFGRGENNEYDCWGLCLEVYKRLGISLPPYKTWINLHLRDTQIKEGKLDFIKISEPEPYCLVTFKLKLNFVTHVGVVLPDCKRFIHILAKRLVCTERLDKYIWVKKRDGFYKFRGEKNE